MTPLGRLLTLMLVLPSLLLMAPPVASAGTPGGPELQYLVGRTVHQASGTSVTLAVPRSHAGHLELLGRSRRGWVVVDWAAAPTIRVLVVTEHGSRTIRRTVDEVNSTWYRLAPGGGTRVLELWADPYADTMRAIVVDLNGRVVDRTTIHGYGEVLDLSRNRAVVSTDEATLLWRIGEQPEPIAGPGESARLETGTLLVRTADGVGPTRIGLPGEPPWTVKGFAPREVSPTGRWVVGTSSGSLEVRRIDTGAVKQRLPVRYRRGDPLHWETARSLLVGVREAGRSALVRCRMDGTCERVTPWHCGRLTTPFQTSYFGE